MTCPKGIIQGATAAETTTPRRLAAQLAMRSKPGYAAGLAMPIGGLRCYASAAAMPIHAAMPAMLRSQRSRVASRPRIRERRAEGQTAWGVIIRLSHFTIIMCTALDLSADDVRNSGPPF